MTVFPQVFDDNVDLTPRALLSRPHGQTWPALQAARCPVDEPPPKLSFIIINVAAMFIEALTKGVLVDSAMRLDTGCCKMQSTFH